MEVDNEDNPRKDAMEVELDRSECYDTGKAVSFIMNLKEMHRIREVYTCLYFMFNQKRG